MCVSDGGGRDGDVVGEWERVGESGRDGKWELEYLDICMCVLYGYNTRIILS